MIPNSWYSSLVNSATNWGPQLDIKALERLWSFQTSLWYRLVIPRTEQVVGKKFALFPTLSTIAMIAL